MSQATRRWISEKVKSLHESDVLPFHDLLDAEMVNSALAAEGVSFNERIDAPLVTLCLFLSQVLDPDHSCRAAVARLIVWLAVNGCKPCSPETNSYCDARQRLPLGVIVRLVHQTARQVEASASDQWLWKGRKVSLVDGTTASMPDTLKNQHVFPQSTSQGIGWGPPTTLAGWRQPATPLLIGAMPLRQWSIQPGIVPQAGQEFDADRAVLGRHQRPDHTPEGIAAVDDRQVPPACDPGLLPKQFDGQLALGPERFPAARTRREPGQLTLAEIEPPGDRQEPGRPAGFIEQRPEHHPVMSPDGGRPVGTASGVLVEGAGAPDVLAAAVDLGVIDSRDVVAVPEPTGGFLDQTGEVAGDGGGVPPAVLGELLHRLPVGGAFEGEHRQSEGVLLDIEGQGRDLLGEPTVSGAGEGPVEGQEQGLPDRPEPLSVSHGGISG